MRTHGIAQCILRLAILCILALGAFAAEDISVNESVLSAINERRIFLGLSPVAWPPNVHGVSPGDFPSADFYQDDGGSVASALRSMAIDHTNALRGSFVFFIGGFLPNEIPRDGNRSLPPFDPDVESKELVTWSDLSKVLRACKFVSGSAGLEWEVRQMDYRVAYGPDYEDALEAGPEAVLELLWRALDAGTWRAPFPEEWPKPYYASAASSIGIQYYMGEPSDSWVPDVVAWQTRARVVVSDSATFRGKPTVVYLRAFQPSDISPTFQNLPGYFPADGRYHRYTQVLVPTTGDWISGQRPANLAYSIYEDSYYPGFPSLDPGYEYHLRDGVSIGICDGPPIAFVEGGFQYPSDEPPVYPPADCADCNRDPSVSSGPKQVCPANVISNQGSQINNLTLRYQHWGFDYSSASDPASCRSCTGNASKPSGDLPCLQIRRIHRYDLVGEPSSLGPAVFLSYDITLRVDGKTITVIDPNADFALVLRADDVGEYSNPTHNLCKRLSLASAAGSPVGTPQEASIAELETRDGRIYRFEFIDAGDGTLRGRLVAQFDRNGNGVSIAHVFASDASLSDLENDRGNLWRISTITDAHGLSATCYYLAGSIAGRPMISRIDLPTGDHIAYHYAQPALGYAKNDIVGFSGATLPGGDEVAIAASRDGGLIKLQVDDPAAQGIHRRKTVWLSEPDVVDPRNGLTTSYQIREVWNGIGEVAYRCRLEQVGSDWQTVVQEGPSLSRLVHTAQGRILRIDRATTWNWANTSDTYTWETTGSYNWDNKIRPTQWVTSTSKSISSTPDPVTNAPARIDHQDGTYSTTTWNAFTQPLTQRDRTGRQTAADYDGTGNRLTQTVGVGSPIAATTQWTYNARGQVLSETDPLNAVTDYSYTAAGFLETVTEPPDAAGGTRAVWTYEYDAAGRRTAMIDPRSHLPIVQRRTTFAWDDRNRLMCTTYPDSSTETSVYGTGDEANLVVRTTDRNGRVTVYDHDGAGRRIGTTLYASLQDYLDNKGEVIESCLYLPGTTQESTCWRRGERIQHAFDGRGRRISTTVWANAATSLTSTTAYDAGGRPWLQTDPYGRRTIQLYDDEDHLTRTIRELVIGALPATLPTLAALADLNRIATPNPPYVIEDMIYDDEGRLLERIDGRGTRTTLAYDARGQCTDVTEDAGLQPATTHSDFDLAGRTVASVSPRLVTTKTDYTLRGLLKRVTEAFDSADAAVVTERTYSETRKVRYETDANQHTTEYQYGGCCDRLLHVVDPIGYMTSFTYDFVGNRKTVQDPNLILTDMQFDAQNRVWRVINGANEATETIYDDNLTDSLGLDATGTPVAGQLGGLGFTAGYADGSAVAVRNPLLQTSYEIRDGLGRPVRRIDPLGHVTRLSYDQIVTDTYTPPGGGAAITQQLVATAMTDAEGHTTAQWADGSGRVRVQVDAENHKARLSYDAAGNQVGQLDANGVGWSASYNGRGFLLSRTDTRASAPVTTSWGYDLDGNRTSETITIDGVLKAESYTYDLRNRRTSIVDRLDGETTFAYDGVGNLVQITDAQDGITTYIYDERNLLKEETFPGPTGGTRSYTYDPGRRLKTRTQQAEP